MTMKFLLILCSILSQSLSFQIKPSTRSPLSTSLSMKNEKLSPFQNLEKKGIATLLGAALFLGFNAPDANALQSGGRSGGSSFRSSGGSSSRSSGGSSFRSSGSTKSYSSGPTRSYSSGSTRSYSSAPTRSYSSGPTRSYSSAPTRSYSSGSTRSYSSAPTRSYSSGPSINIMPMYSPFSPFGFSPFGFMPINFNVILLAGAAYLVYDALSNIKGGQDFSDNAGGFSGSVGSGATVVKLTVALDANWGDDRNIMQQLANLANKYNAMTERSDLARLLSETCLALLRNKGEWNAATYKGEQFRESNFQKAESTFQQIAIQERAKFDEENSDPDAQSSMNLIKPSFDGKVSLPTQAVVSIVVALRGKNNAGSLNNIRSTTDVITCLEQLASAALIDDGENVMALEVLWSPSSRGMTLSDRDLIMDYPELLKL